MREKHRYNSQPASIEHPAFNSNKLSFKSRIRKFFAGRFGHMMLATVIGAAEGSGIVKTKRQDDGKLTIRKLATTRAVLKTVAAPEFTFAKVTAGAGKSLAKAAIRETVYPTGTISNHIIKRPINATPLPSGTLSAKPAELAYPLSVSHSNISPLEHSSRPRRRLDGSPVIRESLPMPFEPIIAPPPPPIN